MLQTLDIDPETISDLSRRIEALERGNDQTETDDALSMVVFSGELDRLLAAMVIATGAAACGTKVSLFFTFWATAGLKKDGPQAKGKSLVERMFGWMLPGGFQRRKLSNLDMCGLGRRMMAREMAKKNVPNLEQLFDVAADLDVKINVCDMSMSLMGIRREELIDYPHIDYCGVATFVEDASTAKTTLFI